MVRDIVLLDNNCIASLASPPALARFLQRVRDDDLTPVVTEINLLEALATPQDSIRNALVDTLRALAGDTPLLPWTFKLLRQLGQAIRDEKDIAQIDSGGIEWYLSDLAACGDIRDECNAFNRSLERDFSEFFDHARMRLQRRYKQSKAERPADLIAFLEGEWLADGIQADFADATWKLLGFESPAPIERLLRCPGWRILFDVEGAAFYYRAVVRVQTRKVGRLDLLQLVYLGAPGRRVFITNEQALLSAGKTIVNDRYLGASVVNMNGFLG